MIEEHVIREILSSVDIMRLVGDYVQLKRVGRSIKGLCPFHAEKTPSFSVSPEKGVYYCFGCGVGGSALDFLMRIEGLSFLDALGRLAEQVGVTLKHVDGGRGLSRRHKRDVQLEIMREASDFFEREFGAEHGAEAREYARARGMSDEMVESFAIGYASGDWEGMPQYLRLRGQDLEEALVLGLVGKRDSGGYYGRFHRRLMFPVRDERGKVIAFSGRALEGGDTAKYINSPESELYTKGEHLFGLYQAKEHIRREKFAILVEGNLDVVMMHAYGFRQTVASLGTALTMEQGKLLSRFADRVVVLYDADAAGRKAAMRSLRVFLSYPMDARIVSLPQGEDPDSFIQIYGREAMASLLGDAEPLSMWCVKQKCESILAAPLELRKHSLGELGDVLKLFTDPLAQRHFLDESARILSMDPKRLAEALSMAYSTRVVARAKTQHLTTSKPSRDPIEWDLLRILLEHPSKLMEFVQEGWAELLENADASMLVKTVSALPQELDANAVMAELEEQRLRSLYNECICSELAVSDELLEDWYRGAVASLAEKWADKEIANVVTALSLSLEQSNDDETESLLERFNALQKFKREAAVDRRMNWKSLERGASTL
ncbi:MAG: DNA primase [Bradymonadales bacterium]